MICFFCKGNMADATNTYMEDLGGCIMIVKNVPCRKCTQCGEVVYSGDVIRRLEKSLPKALKTPSQRSPLSTTKPKQREFYKKSRPAEF